MRAATSYSYGPKATSKSLVPVAEPEGLLVAYAASRGGRRLVATKRGKRGVACSGRVLIISNCFARLIICPLMRFHRRKLHSIMTFGSSMTMISSFSRSHVGIFRHSHQLDDGR
jgi:hypothetical protein